ncbi:kif1 [Symbiodinium natans]|uniref:Kif1 protein n=1 Tax=Symbiodinium natans TaxID=878477 RepID=A0A812QKZ5_9DINO|nr:kif1 [Symbiodinium natans]
MGQSHIDGGGTYSLRFPLELHDRSREIDEREVSDERSKQQAARSSNCQPSSAMLNFRGIQFAVAIAALGTSCHYLWLALRPNSRAHHDSPLFCESGERSPIYFLFAPGLALSGVLLFLAGCEAANAYESCNLWTLAMALRIFAVCAAIGLAGMGLVTNPMSRSFHDLATYAFVGGAASLLLLGIVASTYLQVYSAHEQSCLACLLVRIVLLAHASSRAYEFLGKYGRAMAMVSQADHGGDADTPAVDRKVMKRLLTQSAVAQYAALASLCFSAALLHP